jgi:hypothetical protein
MDEKYKQVPSAEARPLTRGGQFGEFDETGLGTDLTLEWNSSDPNLHAHMSEEAPANELPDTRKWIVWSDEEDRYRHFNEAGLPDA